MSIAANVSQYEYTMALYYLQSHPLLEEEKEKCSNIVECWTTQTKCSPQVRSVILKLEEIYES